MNQISPNTDNPSILSYLSTLRHAWKVVAGNSLFIENAKASYPAFVLLSLLNNTTKILHILPDEYQALASFNELHSLNSQKIFYFPALYLRNGEKHKYYEFNLQQRTSVLEQLSTASSCVIVTYYDAITEPVVQREIFSKQQFIIHKQSSGYRYYFEPLYLRDFDNFSKEHSAKPENITKELVCLWAQKKSYEADKTHENRIVVLRQFALFVKKLGYDAYILPKVVMPKASISNAITELLTLRSLFFIKSFLSMIIDIGHFSTFSL